MRIITFNNGSDRTKSEKRFKTLYEGFLFGQGQSAGIAESRTIASVYDKLCDISDEADDDLPGGDKSRSLSAGEQKLSLTQPELDQLKSHVERANFKVSEKKSQIDVIDNLIAVAEKVDDK